MPMRSPLFVEAKDPPKPRILISAVPVRSHSAQQVAKPIASDSIKTAASKATKLCGISAPTAYKTRYSFTAPAYPREPVAML
jgi:hypothetical protein